MAPARTRARPTGRLTRPPKKDEPITAAESGGVAKKRGRGRPPKNGVAKVVKPSTGRGRGRPPLDPAEKARRAAEKGTAVRGRPPLTAAEKAKRAAERASAAKAKATKEVKPKSGRPRGRPPKNAAAQTTTTPKKAATPRRLITARKSIPASIKSQRGRKRKSEVAAEEPVEEAEANGVEEEHEEATEEPVDNEEQTHDVDFGVEADVEAGAALDDEKEAPAPEETALE